MAEMEIVVGSYEEVIIGLCLRQEGDAYQLTERFTEKIIGSIRCVAVSEKGLLATGGTDEIIRIFDLKKHRLVGTLTHHSGTVTSLQFNDTHLFSTSEDGTLCLWRVANWKPERTFKGHKGPVRHVAVHPSGKMTLTVGEDKTLRLWNNMTGRIAYISNLKEPAELVTWSPGGLYYVVTYRTHLEVFSVESKGLHRSIATSQRVNSVVFVSDTVIAYGGEGKIKKDGEREDATLSFTDILQGDLLLEVPTKCYRIRDLAVCHKNEEMCLTLVSSDGTVNLYLLTNPTQETIKAELMVSRNIALRLTSVAVYTPEQLEKAQPTEKPPLKKKQKMKKKRKLEKTAPESDSQVTKKKRVSEEGGSETKVVKKKVKIAEPDRSMQRKKKQKKPKKPV